MLRAIRGGMNSFLVMLLLGILIASFAVWGIGDIFRLGGGGDVAQVGDTAITAEAYSAEVQQDFRVLQQQFGAAFDSQQAIARGRHVDILQQMIGRAMLDEAARELGLRATNRAVRDAIRAMPAFEGFDGRFDRDVYTRALTFSGFNEDRYETLVRGDLVREQLVEALATTPAVPPSLVDTLYTYRRETRRATLVTVPASAIGDITPPDDATVRAYYDDNIAAFMAPEYRGVDFVVVGIDDLLDLDAVTDDQVAEAYEARLGEYQTPALRSLELAHFDTEADARAFHDRVAAGEDFTAVAVELTDFTADDISLGDLSRLDVEQDYNPRTATEVFAVAVDGVTEPLQSAFGWNVFRVLGETPAVTTTLDQVSRQLARELAREEAAEAIYDVYAAIEDDLGGGATIQEIAANRGLTLQRVDRVSREGLDPAGSLVTTEPSVLPLLETVFTTDVDDDLQVHDLDDGGFFVIDVTAVTPPSERPFEQVADEARGRWLIEERLRRAGERAEQAADRLRGGEEPAAVAAAFGGAVFDSPAIERAVFRQQGSVSPQLASLIFSLDEGELDMDRAANGDGYVIAKLIEVAPGDPATDASRRDELATRLAGEMAGDLFAQYQAGLLARLEVTINEAAINQLFPPPTLP